MPCVPVGRLLEGMTGAQQHVLAQMRSDELEADRQSCCGEAARHRDRLGAALAVYRFRGRGVVVVIFNALMGLPPVVVGLVAYLLLSRSGPLGMLGLLFTPGAMVIAQAILVAPIVTVLVQRTISEPWAIYGDALLVDGTSRLRAIPELLAMSAAGLLTALLAGFGRAIAEIGAIIIVGGNIAGVTRTMTTAIALETSKGNLPLALGLGIILIAISIGVSAAAFILASWRVRL
jgi:tungstate transport system permease protein